MPVIDISEPTRRRVALVARWVLIVEGAVWAGVAVALAAVPGRWTGSAALSWGLAAALLLTGAAFVAAGVGVGRRPPRLVKLALVLAIGGAVSSLADEVGVADLASFTVNLALVALCTVLLLPRPRRPRAAPPRR